MALSKEEVICAGIELMSLLDMESDVEQATQYEERGHYRACAEFILACVEGETEQVDLLTMLKQVKNGTYGKEKRSCKRKAKRKGKRK
jgi:glutamine amidotransferase PdxT